MFQLVEVMLPGEDGPVGENPCQDAAHRTDVNGLGVALELQHDFWSPIPVNGHILYQEPCVVSSVQFSHSIVSDSTVSWTTACQASLSITNSWSLFKLMSIELVMPSNHLILCHPFSSCLQSCPASGSFPVSQFFT